MSVVWGGGCRADGTTRSLNGFATSSKHSQIKRPVRINHTVAVYLCQLFCQEEF